MSIYLVLCLCVFSFCFLKRNTAYELPISGWSSDVCSSHLRRMSWMILLSVADCGRAVMIYCYNFNPGERRRRALVGPHGPLVDKAGAWRGQGSEERRVGKESVSTCRSRRYRYN